MKETDMKTVTSKDGTPIAYDVAGSGPAVIMVTGALGTRNPDMTAGMAGLLSPHFTVYDYDRRGRGDSGDTPPYAVEREIEDIAALIEAAGGTAYLYGMSSGAVLALEAAKALGSRVPKLAMYEPPFIIDDSRPPAPVDYVEQLNAAIASGDRGEAVNIFMTKAILIPEEYVEQMRGGSFTAEGQRAQPPHWMAMEKVAHTLAYDGTIMRGLMLGNPLPKGRWANVGAETVVVVGGNSEPFFHSGAQALVAELRNGQYRVLEGQDHAVDPAALAPVLIEVFGV
jgi:pimeloyl-ACP methyl ester carboxylesterase